MALIWKIVNDHRLHQEAYQTARQTGSTSNQTYFFMIVVIGVNTSSDPLVDNWEVYRDRRYLPGKCRNFSFWLFKSRLSHTLLSVIASWLGCSDKEGKFKWGYRDDTHTQTRTTTHGHEFKLRLIVFNLNILWLCVLTLVHPVLMHGFIWTKNPKFWR